MAFKNRVRLPFYVTRPQFPMESNTFRLANGSRKTLSSVIRKVFEGETDNLPRELHERFVIALKHDDVTIEGKYYLGGVSLEGDYDIDWNKFLDFPLAKAAFKLEVTPFDYSNDNCQTCEDLTQVVCVDDNLGTINEDETVTVHVLDNDNICCRPVTISLVTFNADFLDSCIISGNDIIIHTKPNLPDANSIVLVTYRAQCPNGAYDEANILADINGSTPSCQAPTNLIVTSVTDTEVNLQWDAIPGIFGFSWSLYQAPDFINPIVTGGADAGETTDSIPGLNPNTSYRLYLRTICGVPGNFSYSNYVYVDFTTNPSDAETCGQYQLYNNDFPTNYAIVSYIDCNGNEQDIHVQGSTTNLICALQNSPGEPVSIYSNGEVDINYIGLC